MRVAELFDMYTKDEEKEQSRYFFRRRIMSYVLKRCKMSVDLPGNIGGGRLSSCHCWQERGEARPKRFRHLTSRQETTLHYVRQIGEQKKQVAINLILPFKRVFPPRGLISSLLKCCHYCYQMVKYQLSKNMQLYPGMPLEGQFCGFCWCRHRVTEIATNTSGVI